MSKERFMKDEDGFPMIAVRDDGEIQNKK